MINSAQPTYSMTVSSEMSSLTELSAISSKIFKWIEIGGAKIGSVEDFENTVGLGVEEIARAEANYDETITAEYFDENMSILPYLNVRANDSIEEINHQHFSKSRK